MTVSTEHIEATPGVRGGKPRIAGTGITVHNIVTDHYRCGWSVEEIVRQFPHLTPAGVHAALAYYHDHKAEIDRQIEEDNRFVEEMRRNAPPSRVQTMLDKMALEDASSADVRGE